MTERQEKTNNKIKQQIKSKANYKNTSADNRYTSKGKKKWNAEHGFMVVRGTWQNCNWVRDNKSTRSIRRGRKSVPVVSSWRKRWR